jgi:predicted NBD/HSP70 family sugar kinase
VFCEKPLNLQTIFAAANKGDSFACKLMDEIIRWFSLAINNITIVYDPDVVILQGSYREAGDYFINGLYRFLRALPFYRGKYNLSIIYSRIDQVLAMPKGGSYYATAHYLQLTPPREVKKKKAGMWISGTNPV